MKAGTQPSTCISVFTAELFTRDKRWQWLKCPSPHEWRNKMWHMQTAGYHSALEENEILMYATTWITWKHYAKWNKKTHTKKYYLIPFIWGLSLSKNPRPMTYFSSQSIGFINLQRHKLLWKSPQSQPVLTAKPTSCCTYCLVLVDEFYRFTTYFTREFKRWIIFLRPL